jgi:hypothetical protein
LVTKQRILLLLYNKVAAKRGEESGTKTKIVPKLQLERGLHQDNEERLKQISSVSLRQLMVNRQKKLSQPRSNYRKRCLQAQQALDSEV